MEKDMTRKRFLAAAAAAGAAALVPGTAMADSSAEPGAAPLAALDVEPVEDAEALAGSEWAAMAAGDTIDVIKSHSGMHVMNAPGYFVFTGWDPENDWTSDLGFGFVHGDFIVKASEVRIESTDVYMGGVPMSRSEGLLDLIDVSARDASYPPKYCTSGGWLHLQGRVTDLGVDGRIADLSGLAAPSALPVGANRNFCCVGNGSHGGPQFYNIYLAPDGMLRVGSVGNLGGDAFVDLSGVSVAAR